MTGQVPPGGEIVVAEHGPGSRYELHVGGRLASFTEVVPEGGRVVMPHTVTIPEFRGRGFAAIVVKAALDSIAEAGDTVVPSCWFVAEFIDAHPEYQPLVAHG